MYRVLLINVFKYDRVVSRRIIVMQIVMVGFLEEERICITL